MIDFRLSSTDSKNLEGYIAKLRKKGFKVEKKTLEVKTPMTKGRVHTYKDTFYDISIETIQELLNLRKIIKRPLIIMDAYNGGDVPNEIEIYDNWRE